MRQALDHLVFVVALRKESVDRNIQYEKTCAGVNWSLSARRAWIEISNTKKPVPVSIVALRKESVDRNFRLVHMLEGSIRRSPQGERG